MLFGNESICTLHYFYPDSFSLIEGDIRDNGLLRSSLNDKDVVLHLAAIVGDPAYSVRADEAAEINDVVTKSLGVIADEVGVDRIMYSSTCSVIGPVKSG